MKIRQETDYAIRAIHALIKAKGKPLLSKEIAAAESVPPNYILTIMCKLKAAGFVAVTVKTKEQKGGYTLIVDPNKISLFDIITAFEGEIQINTCLRDEKNCPNQKNCLVRDEMRRVNDILNSELKRKSLAEILKERSDPDKYTLDCAG